jgi:hypothetical protein
MSIQALILNHVENVLQDALIDNVHSDDISRAGSVIQGPLQGNPDPDQARISIQVLENDPDQIYKPGNSTMTGSWTDEVSLIECGGSITMKRRYSVKARCLLVNTAEGLDDARHIASDVKHRIERVLTGIDFTGIATPEEFVSKGILSTAIKSESIQAGGPPDAYDYHIKVRFELDTTRSIIQ